MQIIKIVWSSPLTERFGKWCMDMRIFFKIYLYFFACQPPHSNIVPRCNALSCPVEDN